MGITRLMSSKDLWTPKEAAIYLGVSPATIRRWLRGDSPETSLPHVRLGGRIFLFKNELDKFVDINTHNQERAS